MHRLWSLALSPARPPRGPIPRRSRWAPRADQVPRAAACAARPRWASTPDPAVDPGSRRLASRHREQGPFVPLRPSCPGSDHPADRRCSSVHVLQILTWIRMAATIAFASHPREPAGGPPGHVPGPHHPLVGPRLPREHRRAVGSGWSGPARRVASLMSRPRGLLARSIRYDHRHVDLELGRRAGTSRAHHRVPRRSVAPSPGDRRRVAAGPPLRTTAAAGDLPQYCPGAVSASAAGRASPARYRRSPRRRPVREREERGAEQAPRQTGPRRERAPPGIQGRSFERNPAASYSPGGSTPKYHRRWRA